MKQQRPPLCKCGCGQPVKRNGKGWNTYINRHSRKGAKNTETSKKAVSIANTKFDSLEKHLLAKTKTKTDNSCWIYVGPRDKDGYGQLKHKGRQFKAHRIAYEIYVGIIPNGLLVCHHCDNPSCVNPEHLFLGTAKDNLMDASRKGRLLKKVETKKKMSISKRGTKNHFYGKIHTTKTKKKLSLACGKLTERQVTKIRKLSKSGILGKQLAKRFNISHGAISGIINNKTYCFIGGNE